MQLARSASAVHPRRFGRGPRKQLEPASRAASRISDDIKLFATTFAAGFIFVSVLLA
ncbi:MAG TPA: hypothetical protein VNS11_00880 [Sphingomicrobium sp.]|nr:hypothetical protein [Sphingomicrobium sp.]